MRVREWEVVVCLLEIVLCFYWCRILGIYTKCYWERGSNCSMLRGDCACCRIARIHNSSVYDIVPSMNFAQFIWNIHGLISFPSFLIIRFENSLRLKQLLQNCQSTLDFTFAAIFWCCLLYSLFLRKSCDQFQWRTVGK